MIDHVTLRVSDFQASKAFYETVLAPLGHAAPWSDEEQRAADWGTLYDVDEFHRVALAAGYRDNGGPGERPSYRDQYYGAFVLDPDRNNVEPVFHDR